MKPKITDAARIPAIIESFLLVFLVLPQVAGFNTIVIVFQVLQSTKKF
jgi:hypothetical protein